MHFSQSRMTGETERSIPLTQSTSVSSTGSCDWDTSRHSNIISVKRFTISFFPQRKHLEKLFLNIKVKMFIKNISTTLVKKTGVSHVCIYVCVWVSVCLLLTF